jgi:hypothetical protein
LIAGSFCGSGGEIKLQGISGYEAIAADKIRAACNDFPLDFEEALIDFEANQFGSAEEKHGGEIANSGSDFDKSGIGSGGCGLGNGFQDALIRKKALAEAVIGFDSEAFKNGAQAVSGSKIRFATKGVGGDSPGAAFGFGGLGTE